MPESFDFDELNLPQDSEYHRLVERCPDIRAMRFETGEYLIEQGEKSLEIYVVLCGAYEVQQKKESPENRSAVPLTTVQKDDISSPSFVGELAYLGGGFRTASVRCLEPTYTLCLRSEHLNIILGEFPLFTQFFCKQLADHLRNTTNALRDNQKLFAMEEHYMSKNPGEVLFTRGDPADTLYQLVEGALTREDQGIQEELASDRLYLGFIDPVPYFCDGKYSTTVRARTRITVIAFSRDSKFAVIRNMPDLILKCLSDRYEME